MPVAEYLIFFIAIVRTIHGWFTQKGVHGWTGAPHTSEHLLIHLIHEKKGTYWGTYCGKRGLILDWGQKEEDRAEEKAINTQGGEQVSQTNVIYSVYVPYCADR